MLIFLSALLVLPSVRASKSGDLIIFDNFEFGGVDFGPEDNIGDYAFLASDKNLDLPSSFTICSSAHLNFVTSFVFFYQLYQDDGKPWFSLCVSAQRIIDTFQERVEFVYHSQSNIKPNKDPVGVVPNSWYHACTALDTVTGHMLTKSYKS